MFWNEMNFEKQKKHKVFKSISVFWQQWESENRHHVCAPSSAPLGAGLHQALHWLLWLLTDWQLL